MRMNSHNEEDVMVSTDKDIVHHFFDASSVAIVGASSNGLKAAGRTLRYLQRYEFRGDIYPINPHRDTVQGLTCYPNLAALPVVPELVVVVLPASEVIETVEECGRLGVPAAIVFASGFAETGPAGKALQDELAQVARRHHIRILGPNSNGAVGVSSGLTATFMSGIDDDELTLRDDGVAFVTQSGAMGAFILTQAQSSALGVNRFASTGNEMDVTSSEMIGALAQDPATRVILGYIEGVQDPQGLRAALATAESNEIPVCLMKVGRSTAGAAAALSHTGALAGEDAVFDGLLSQYGAIRATDVDHLLDLGRIFALCDTPTGRRLSIVTLSGGAGVLMADAAEDHGLTVAPWDDMWAEKLQARLPSFASVRNPIDVTGALVTDPTLLSGALEVCAEHPDTDVIVVMLGNMQKQEPEVCDIISAAASRTSKPIITVWVGGTGHAVRRLAEAGLACFTEPVRAVRAIAALTHGLPPADAHGHEVPKTQSDAESKSDPLEPASVVDEVEAKKRLAACGIPTVAEREATTVADACAAADELGYPVVVKVLSTEVAHKSDLGLVATSLATSADVERASERIVQRTVELGISDRRLVVQRMVSSQTELILGMRRDPVFGPVIVLGIGGVLTEITADVQIRLPPVASRDALAMMDGLEYAALLRGPRGRVPVDREALAAVIQRFSGFVAEQGEALESLEINPLLIDGDGHPVAVDALLVEAP